MKVKFREPSPEHFRVLAEIDQLMTGKDNDFAASIALTLFLNVLLKGADGDAGKANDIADNFAAHAKAAFAAVLAGKHKGPMH